MNKRCLAAIGMLVFCFMMLTAGAGWCWKVDNGTITDTATGLVWLKNADCFGKKDWNSAMSSAQSLSSGSCGLSDGSKAGQWRLPTKDELKAIFSKKNGFTNVQSGLYWSSTTIAYDTDSAWIVSMLYGDVYNDFKTYNYYVWPVRAGQ